MAIEVSHEASIAGANKFARAAERVDLTCTSNELLATRGGSGILDSEEATSGRSVLDRSFDTGERIALSENLSASRDLESMTGVVLPVVVDRVQHGVTSNLGSATRSAVDVVALEGDGVLGASEVKGPVLMAIAGSRPVRCAINLVVGDGDTTGSNLAQNDVLTTDQGCL